MTYVNPAEEVPRGTASIGTRAGLIALMLLGALALWIGDPVLWLWITSRLQSGTQASMGPYGLMILGIILTAVAMGKGLSRLNRFYGEVTGTAPTVRIVLPWRRSIRDSRHGGSGDEDGRLPVSLLDVVMVIAVLVGVAAFVAWFVIVQPAPPLPGGPGGAKH